MPPENFLYQSQWIPEESTWYYTRTLTDELGVPISSTNLTTITLSLYEMDTPEQEFILDWDAKDVKNVNGGTVNTSGKFELRLPPTATIILNTARVYERRQLLLTWTRSDGRTWRHIINVAIENLHKIP
jgi:hypothetical protein